MAIVGFQNVSFSYDGHAKALDGVTLSIERGSFVCVLGGNGSGKSTLARHVDALLLPDAGKVCVLGLDTSDGGNLLEVRSNAGLVFQNPDDQIVAAMVEDDVAFGPENLGVPSDELPGRVQGALERVGLGNFGKRETFALSGGQKQRVAIAGICAMDPQVIVFDEAGSMLDPRGRRGLMRLCRELNDAGITIVLITHSMEEAALADRVVVLKSGKVAMDGAPQEVLSRARELRELNLEPPFAAQMSLALQDAGMPVPTCVEEQQLEGELEGLLGVAGVPRQDAGAPSGAMRACEAAAHEGEPVITLEDVSFSYAPKQARKACKAERRRAGASVGGACEPRKAGAGSGGSQWALRDVSLSLNEGDFLGIAGHTGSGKSTLAQLLAGILRPTAGHASVRGRNLADKRNLAEARRSVGMVFQYPEHQLFAPTVFEDVAFGPRNLGFSQEEADLKVCKALELVHLSPDKVGERSPFELSGGQQRRVALAGVLAMEPEVLVLDEPTAGLDPKSHELFLGLISELHRTSNVATVIVSHDMDDLARLCNRVMLMNEGRVVADGSPALIFSDEDAIARIGLGVPHTTHLANRLGMLGLFCTVPTVVELAGQVVARWRSLAGNGCGVDEAAASPTAGLRGMDERGPEGGRA